MGYQEQLDYSHVSKLTYLDMCLSEALRIYPVAPLLMRAVNKVGCCQDINAHMGSYLLNIGD